MLDATLRAADTGRAMSKENVEMVRAGYDAFNHGDVEAALAPLHPNIEWWPAADEPITSRIGVTMDSQADR